jgi:hypothetical protein
MVTTKASQLCADFRRKTVRAKDLAIRRFVASSGFVHRVHAHQSQRSMEEVKGEVKDWMESIRPLIDKRGDLAYIVENTNRDEIE